MGGASSSSAATASPIATDTQFRRGKLACQFFMISNCALAVYIITRPGKRERNKAGSGRAATPAPAPDEDPREAPQQQISDLAGAEVRIEADQMLR
ncbi:hypothetical protein QQ045_008418 [Rhodiola kirilowii]